MFKVGDRVRCVNRNESYPNGLVIGAIYTVKEVYSDPMGQELVKLREKIPGYFGSRFELADSAVQGLQNVPNPSKPYPYEATDEDKEKEQREALRKYRQDMRNYLYGTTSEGE